MERRNHIILAVFIVLLMSIEFVSAERIRPELKDRLENMTLDEELWVIVSFNRAIQNQERENLKSAGASIQRSFHRFQGALLHASPRAIERIAELPFVDYVEPNYKVKMVLDKAGPQINLDLVYENNITGKDVQVAVFDTGIDDNAVELNVVKDVDFTEEGTDDLNGHGTHVAGILNSNKDTLKGVAPDAELYDIKVLNQDGEGFASDILSGIEWAIDNNVDVISMSLGAEVEVCDGTDAISRMVDEAVEEGIVVVVAAGNNGPDSNTILSPGCANDALTVGAVDSDDNIASWSSRGPTDDGRVKPDVMAPGVSITSLWPGGETATLSGTSMAAPFVSGLASLILELNSSLSPNKVKDVIKETALDLGLDENVQGAGRINAYAAYELLAPLKSNESLDNETNLTPINDTPENQTSKPEEAPMPLNRSKGNDSSFMPPGLEKDVPGFAFGLSKRFSLRNIFRELSLLFTFSPEKKLERRIEFAEEALEKAEEEMQKGDTEEAQEELREYYENMQEITKMEQEIKTDVEERIQQLRNQERNLYDTIEKLPQQEREEKDEENEEEDQEDQEDQEEGGVDEEDDLENELNGIPPEETRGNIGKDEAIYPSSEDDAPNKPNVPQTNNEEETKIKKPRRMQEEISDDIKEIDDKSEERDKEDMDEGKRREESDNKEGVSASSPLSNLEQKDNEKEEKDEENDEEDNKDTEETEDSKGNAGMKGRETSGQAKANKEKQESVRGNLPLITGSFFETIFSWFFG
jgi:serine protease AprX